MIHDTERDKGDMEEIADLRAQVAALKQENTAIRELMNCYNVGGWTDAIAPMVRAIEAEKKVAALTKDNDDIHELAEHYRVENGRLREALAPFVAAYDRAKSSEAWASSYLDNSAWPKARAALEQP